MTLKKAISITKYQIRLLLGANGEPMPSTTWRKWWKKHGLHIHLGLTESDFANRKTFEFEEFEKLKQLIGFEESDLYEV